MEPFAERIGLGAPLLHGLRPREAEHLPRAWHRIVPVRKARHHAGALVDEGQRLGIVHPLEGRRGVGLRLFLYRRDLVPPLIPLRFNDADGLPLDEQHVVCRPDVGRILADRDPGAGTEVDLPHRLHAPSRLLQLGVDGGARPLLGSTVVVSHRCNVFFCQVALLHGARESSPAPVDLLAMPYHKHGDQPNAVVDFVKYAVLPDSQAVGIRATGKFPASREVEARPRGL